jgi:hypothetical protein
VEVEEEEAFEEDKLVTGETSSEEYFHSRGEEKVLEFNY